ncbi:MAG: bifunctional diaminohydroxyphosphoribosylaminopyrimidine deaminase/5-amino-6-(5-phosphoribosylamino)uracil reductase RibD [Elusimicrobiota bacterium]|jgi:diaminohydroxyphosphoribosylaminopyrimidine deaminase/5-amino-6-(5-phosphoribosylamino)uracil reductase
MRPATPDQRAMHRAIVLARRGAGAVSPNPRVGCVIVKNGRVIAEGFHARYGGPHAEQEALRKAGKRAQGATAYVNLEPCCHYGKTPPCAKALIAAGVRRVVAAMKDPNPLVSGKGFAFLRRAGVIVEHGVLEEEARRLNRSFIHFMETGRPYVILKAAASLDGRTADGWGRSKWITSEAARGFSRALRAEIDAILVGAETVLADDPRLTAEACDAGSASSPARGVRRILRNPVRVILDSRLRTPAKARVLDEAAPTILACACKKERPLPPNVSILRLPSSKEGLDLKALLRALAGRGISSLLVEGGSRVHTSFLQAGLVDEVQLYLSPQVLGGKNAPSIFEGRGFPLRSAPKLRDISIRRIGSDLLVQGRMGPAKSGPGPRTTPKHARRKGV